ncbi:MAG: FtsW/RodA/SpoVE family cell cycle protein [Muribaculaceae bacterium]|nr:FtsW/RodA/SpoVE family cell cycle protein [Muribaculaceae bacterium]MDE5967779.1 FtsW/RodA/SpoVE family cell cycle protein [Muribaculaceae bacterium]
MSDDIDELLRLADQPQRPADPEPESDKKPKTKADDKEGMPRVKADKYILALYLALCVISIIELYSASSREVQGGHIFAPIIRHCMMLAMGVCVCLGVSRLSLGTIRKLAIPFSIVSVGMGVYVLMFARAINGALRSFSLFGIQIQPAEFLKLSAVLTIAYFTAKNQEKGGGVTDKGVIWSAVAVVVFSGLLFSQGLTNTLLLMAISCSMMLIAGVQWRKFLMVVVIYGLLGGCGVAYKSMSDKGATTVEDIVYNQDGDNEARSINRIVTWRSRMARFFESDKYNQPITSDNRQEMYSFMAQANGGVFGVFPGNSRETARLPLAFSDYIYSIIIEDLGLVGGFVVLIIYLSLLGRAGALAWRCDRVFPALLMLGIAVMITFQALFHMAIVTGVFPVSGQPLPMISKGGTSILVTSLGFGIMLAVSRYVARTQMAADKGKDHAEGDELPSELNAVNPSQITEK